MCMVLNTNKWGRRLWNLQNVSRVKTKTCMANDVGPWHMKTNIKIQRGKTLEEEKINCYAIWTLFGMYYARTIIKNH